jgi:crotonobetainyl-CoA:carnitine CoA-transferase CaiB-like acyl-CoA transferase
VLIARFEQAGTAWARLNGVDGLSAHSQLRRVTAQTPTGPVALPAPPARWDGEVPQARPVPGLGAQGDAIRAEFA